MKILNLTIQAQNRRSIFTDYIEERLLQYKGPVLEDFLLGQVKLDKSLVEPIQEYLLQIIHRIYNPGIPLRNVLVFSCSNHYRLESFLRSFTIKYGVVSLRRTFSSSVNKNSVYSYMQGRNVIFQNNFRYVKSEKGWATLKDFMLRNQDTFSVEVWGKPTPPPEVYDRVFVPIGIASENIEERDWFRLVNVEFSSYNDYPKRSLKDKIWSEMAQVYKERQGL